MHFCSSLFTSYNGHFHLFLYLPFSFFFGYFVSENGRIGRDERRGKMGRGKAFDHKKKGMERERPKTADQTKFPHEASTGHKTIRNEDREE